VSLHHLELTLAFHQQTMDQAYRNWNTGLNEKNIPGKPLREFPVNIDVEDENLKDVEEFMILTDLKI
jgi:hypothetical protein